MLLTQDKKKVWLNEVSYIRPLAILLVVLMHSFALYTGGTWKIPDGFKHIELYEWIPYFFTAFRMPTIVFIAGYVFAFQYENNKYKAFKPLAAEKFKRLIIPGIFFSILYLIIPIKGVDSVNYSYKIWEGNFSKIINGAGHIWFLPMLFWNFILGFILIRQKFNDKITLSVLFIISIIAPIITIPFLKSFTNALNFIYFFYLGNILWNKRKEAIELLTYRNNIVLISVVYVILFVIYSYIDKIIFTDNVSNFVKLVLRILKYGLFTAGVLTFYSLVIFFTEVKRHIPCQFIKNLSKISYGIYIYHQFILMYLIYNLKLYNIINPLLLPWVLFFVTLITSYILTHLTLRTKFGSNLIG